jgi:hypothetical protein
MDVCEPQAAQIEAQTSRARPVETQPNDKTTIVSRGKKTATLSQPVPHLKQKPPYTLPRPVQMVSNPPLGTPKPCPLFCHRLTAIDHLLTLLPLVQRPSFPLAATSTTPNFALLSPV